MVKPYNDIIICENEWIRTFSADMNNIELIWHRDRRDREIHVLYGDGWKFQRDNELPFVINKNNTFKIKAFTYHRLIIGITDLTIKIREI